MSIAPRTRKTMPARVRSGIAGLDTILGGGFRLGGMYMVEGVPGAGKTILVSQISFHHVAAGDTALFITLLAENHARMISNMRGMAFFDEGVFPDRMAYPSAFNKMREGGPEALPDLLRREVLHRRTSLLVVDGLVSARASAASDQAFKELVHGLQEFALATDCTMVLTTRSSDSAAPEQTMVDGLIELTDRPYGWQVQSALRVRKFRGGSFLRGRHSCTITDEGITVYSCIEALFARPSRPAEAGSGRTSTGLDQLDAMLDGGLPVASTTMLMGPRASARPPRGCTSWPAPRRPSQTSCSGSTSRRHACAPRPIGSARSLARCSTAGP